MLNNLQTEEFCKTICQKYLNAMDREMVLEQDNGAVFRIFLKDEYSYLKDEGKINNENYHNYLDYDYDVYIYDSYQSLYYDYIKEEVENDIEDLGLFDGQDWNFYLSFEELQKMGYAFEVADYYPEISEYLGSKTNAWSNLTLEELNELENLIADFPNFIEQELEKLLDKDGNIIIEKVCTDTTLKKYGEKIDELLEDDDFRKYYHEEIDPLLIENNQERFNELIYENLFGESYDIIFNDFPFTIYDDACNYFVVNENSSLNSFDYHPANILSDHIGDVVCYVYGINLNYFTDKFFKGRDDKSNSSQESPKKDTFDMDK